MTLFFVISQPFFLYFGILLCHTLATQQLVMAGDVYDKHHLSLCATQQNRPHLHRAKSAPNVPVIPLEDSRRDMLNTLNIRESSFATTQTKVANLEWQQIQVAISYKDYDGALEKLERLHIAPTLLRELPFHYNRGLLNLLRFQKTHHRMYLQHARLDFNNAISACRHFYFSYLALAQIAFWMRDFNTAYNTLKALIDVFEQTHSQEGDTLLIHNSQFSGMMYLGDLYVNCALALYRLGADRVSVNEHFNYGIGILRRTHALSYDVFQRHRVEGKLSEYRRAMHPQAEISTLFGFNIQGFIQKYDAEYDAGPLQWLELSCVLLMLPTENTLISHQHHYAEPQLPPVRSKPAHYMTPANAAQPHRDQKIHMAQKRDVRSLGHRFSNWIHKRSQ